MKSNHKPISTIDDPSFDFEEEFCNRVYKMRGVAELFIHVDAESRPVFSVEAYHGISYMIKDTAEELQAICYKMLEWEGGAK